MLWVEMTVDLEAELINAGALLKGHFVLTSGRHSDTYFEKFRILEQPKVLCLLCAQIAEHFSEFDIDAVAGPTTGGIILAFEVARQMGLPAIYVESENGEKTLRRGKTLPAGHRVLVVDDVLTTGKSVIETVEAINKAGGEVCGVGVLIDRSENQIDFGAPFFTSYKVEAKSYAPEDVPAELAAIPTTKPGTRVL